MLKHLLEARTPLTKKNPNNLVKPKPYKVEGIGVDVLDGLYNPSN